MKKIILFTILSVFSTFNLMAQESDIKNSNKNLAPTNTQFLENGNIKDQFNFIMQNSDSYTNYKVVRNEWLNKYNGNVLDSLNKLKTELTVTKQQNLTIENENAALKSEIKLNEELLQKRDTISFLGIPMKKGAFQGVMWTLVVGLAVGLTYFVIKYKNNFVITKNAIQRYEELDTEFKEARSRALEREQILNRQLFDEQKKNRS